VSTPEFALDNTVVVIHVVTNLKVVAIECDSQ